MEEDELKPVNEQMEIEPTPGQPGPSPTGGVGDEMIDDEEIQAAMSRMRREAGKMRNKQKKKVDESGPMEEHVLQAVEEEEEVHERFQPTLEEEEEDNPNLLVIDDTSEFIRMISLPQERAAAAAKKKNSEELQLHSQQIPSPTSLVPGPSRADTVMAGSEIDEEEERREMERLMAGDEKRTGDGRPEGDVTEQDTAVYGATGSEKYVRGGMASTLSLLKAQGLIKPLTHEEREKERLYKEKTRWLVEQRRRDALREVEKERTKRMGDAKDQATREYENRMRESTMAKESMEAYRHYKPDVEIKYNDEFGRELTQKEAWKALSHKFHGKGSGKAKTEKRIKKIEEEKKLVCLPPCFFLSWMCCNVLWS